MRRILAITLTIFAVLSCGLGSSRQGGHSGKTESITLASLPLEALALVYIAEKEQFFSENGLAVTIKDYDTGVATVDAMLKGEADMAGPTEFVVVRNVLQRQPISILGSIEKGLTMSLTGLKTRGISGVADLVGKRIGLARGSIAEFYLGRFLDLHGMSVRDVVLVDLSPSKWQDAVSSGDVDAIVGWLPYSIQLQQRFKNKTVSWQVQSGQQLFGVTEIAVEIDFSKQ